MYGYTAALILNDSESVKDINTEILKQEKGKYIVITIKQPSI